MNHQTKVPLPLTELKYDTNVYIHFFNENSDTTPVPPVPPIPPVPPVQCPKAGEGGWTAYSANGKSYWKSHGIDNYPGAMQGCYVKGGSSILASVSGSGADDKVSIDLNKFLVNCIAGGR